MGFRFFRRMKIAPGVSVNLSKSGASMSFGPRGAKVTVGPRGVRKTVGIPGTGAYYTTQSGYGQRRSRRTAQLATPLSEIRETYEFDVSCQGSVPQSIVAFLEASDFEDAIRNAISLGGDADTMACIAGGIAEAYWGVPDKIERRALAYLDDRLRRVVDEFIRRFGVSKHGGNV